jgi:hypothetical protein
MSQVCPCGCDGSPSRGATYIKGHRPHPSLREVLYRGFTAAEGDDCWEWHRHIAADGYGHVGVPGERKVIGAHRASWIVHNGPIPTGLFVCHTCDNRRCVRPDHLFLGTHLDNMRDKVAKGRHVTSRGEQHGNAKITDEQVRQIRARWRRGARPHNRTGSSVQELAREFGITERYVGELVRMESRRAT